MNDLQWCYRVLDLEPGASPEEVSQAYKDLVFVWHPDRIPQDNERLRQKAQEKLRTINLAYEHLRKAAVQPRPTFRPAPRAGSDRAACRRC